MKTIVHVHQQRIRQNINKVTEDRQPPLIIRQRGKSQYSNALEIKGPCRIIYSPDKPLSCGARVWIETDSEVVGAI